VRQWANDGVFPGRGSGPSPELPFQVRVEADVWAATRREIARMAGRRGPHVETGGLLLGQIDRASQVVWVTEADGLPPGSTAYEEGLELDPTQARELAARRRHTTRGMVAYIGTWHTHPDHPANPSEKDRAAMQKIAGDGVPVLLMILGGGPGRLARWTDGGNRPEMSLELYLPD
jgi:integrative and conjugative element protein (TIGR02256 family)